MFLSEVRRDYGELYFAGAHFQRNDVLLGVPLFENVRRHSPQIAVDVYCHMFNLKRDSISSDHSRAWQTSSGEEKAAAIMNYLRTNKIPCPEFSSELVSAAINLFTIAKYFKESNNDTGVSLFNQMCQQPSMQSDIYWHLHKIVCVSMPHDAHKCGRELLLDQDPSKRISPHIKANAIFIYLEQKGFPTSEIDYNSSKTASSACSFSLQPSSISQQSIPLHQTSLSVDPFYSQSSAYVSSPSASTSSLRAPSLPYPPSPRIMPYSIPLQESPYVSSPSVSTSSLRAPSLPYPPSPCIMPYSFPLQPCQYHSAMIPPSSLPAQQFPFSSPSVSMFDATPAKPKKKSAKSHKKKTKKPIKHEEPKKIMDSRLISRVNEDVKEIIKSRVKGFFTQVTVVTEDYYFKSQGTYKARVITISKTTWESWCTGISEFFWSLFGYKSDKNETIDPQIIQDFITGVKTDGDRAKDQLKVLATKCQTIIIALALEKNGPINVDISDPSTGVLFAEKAGTVAGQFFTKLLLIK